jgi:hypothetical protein
MQQPGDNVLRRLLPGLLGALVMTSLKAQPAHAQWRMLDSVLSAARERVARGPASGLVVSLIDESGARHSRVMPPNSVCCRQPIGLARRRSLL